MPNRKKSRDDAGNATMFPYASVRKQWWRRKSYNFDQDDDASEDRSTLGDEIPSDDGDDDEDEVEDIGTNSAESNGKSSSLAVPDKDDDADTRSDIPGGGGGAEGAETMVYGSALPFEEDARHEFKALQLTSDLLSGVRRHATKHANAFLNTSGGSLYLGVTDSGRVRGIPLSRPMRDKVRLTVDQVISHFTPSVDPVTVKLRFVEVTLPPGKRFKGGKKNTARYVVLLSVPKGTQAVYRTTPKANSPAFWRRNASTERIPAGAIAERVAMTFDAPPNEEDEANNDDVSVRTGGGGDPQGEGAVVARPMSPVVGSVRKDSGGSEQPVAPKPPPGGWEMLGRGAEMERVSSAVENATSPVVLLISGPPFTGKATVSRAMLRTVTRRFVTLTPMMVALLTPNESADEKNAGKMEAGKTDGGNGSLSAQVFTGRLISPLVSSTEKTRAGGSSGAHLFTGAHAVMVAVMRMLAANDRAGDREKGAVVDPALGITTDEEIEEAYDAMFEDKTSALLVEGLTMVEGIASIIPRVSRGKVVIAATSVNVLDDSPFYLSPRSPCDVLNLLLHPLTPDVGKLLVMSVAPWTDEMEAEELARNCGGLPMIIRTAASALVRRPDLSAIDLAKRLEASREEDACCSPAPLGPLPQRVFNVTYDALSEKVRSILGKLVAFPMGFDLMAAAWALGLTSLDEASDALGLLLSHSLLHYHRPQLPSIGCEAIVVDSAASPFSFQTGSSPGVGACGPMVPAHYSLNTAIRGFLKRRLETDGGNEVRDAKRRHLEGFSARLTDEVRRGARDYKTRQRIAAIRLDSPNYSAALHYSLSLRRRSHGEEPDRETLVRYTWRLAIGMVVLESRDRRLGGSGGLFVRVAKRDGYTGIPQPVVAGYAARRSTDD